MIYSPMQYCRHWDVQWEDEHRCRCQSCGKQGQWYEEGYVLWSKQVKVKTDVLCSAERPRTRVSPEPLSGRATVVALLTGRDVPSGDAKRVVTERATPGSSSAARAPRNVA